MQGSIGFSRLADSFVKHLFINPPVDSSSNRTLVSLFLREYFLFYKNKSEIVNNFINLESSKWAIKIADYNEYIVSEIDIESLSKNIDSFNSNIETLNRNSQKPIHSSIHPDYRNEIIQVVFIWNTDIYFNYLNGNFTYQKTKNLLRMTNKFVNSLDDNSEDFEHFTFQLFNFGIYNGTQLFGYDDLFTPGMKSVTTYTKLYGSSSDINNVIAGEVFVPSSLSSKNLIGIIIKQNSMEREYPLNSIAVIERESDFNNGDTVAISINKDPFILSKVHTLTDKLLIEFVGSGSEKTTQLILDKNQVDVLGKVVYGVIPSI